ncbi:acetate/propionate family kinase [Glacieibacterium megasporae]|uniref:acetate/propionate family kinase n=1 Tax=Glacieibacterium megasporae TaxID=2835787 RepID=UPI001C1E1BC8|nr:acetate/propionate family kinase [Polymorphobacter megasporae]UAJ12872.1 acetate/propionate family kinase [Polymorphobacter megasporae]
MSTDDIILTLNGGSSSIKFALFPAQGSLVRFLSGAVDGIGSANPLLHMKTTGSAATAMKAAAADHRAAGDLVLATAEREVAGQRVLAVGHRIVHGGPDFVRPQRVGTTEIDALRRLVPLDPEHLPIELALVMAAMRCFPSAIQVACFDTAFHHAMPRVAKLLPMPLRYAAKGVIRYGFHGQSYAYVMGEIERLCGVAAAHGRIVIAHLGSGASLAAVHGGWPIDTSMGFTPASGVPMGTRCGDIDPGLAPYLARTEAMDIATFDQMANFESGLLGLSETSADMRDLLACEASDPRAADAVALFCYAVKQRIGAFAASLGGIDMLVFTGGVGANAPVIRARICNGLGFLGVVVDPDRNDAGAAIASPDAGQVMIRVMPTDEEVMIAGSTRDLAVAGHTR